MAIKILLKKCPDFVDQNNLAWSYIEAANIAIRNYEPAKKFYQKKLCKTNRIVAIKALAHKLARAAYYVMRDQVPFKEALLFK